MSNIMNHQDHYQFDPRTTAPYTVFKKIGSNRFFVNSSCVLAKKGIIISGEEFLLVDQSTGPTGKVSNVLLCDCYYRDGIINLILRDIRTQVVSTLHHGIEFPERPCDFVLIDPDYLREWINLKAIQAYCDCEIDSKKKCSTEINQKSNQDNNLLDFDY